MLSPPVTINRNHHQQQLQNSSGPKIPRPTSLFAPYLQDRPLSSSSSSSSTTTTTTQPSGTSSSSSSGYRQQKRLWTVNDTSLRPIPRHYPKLDPKCTVYISDASPSVIAVRIAECLRKRSISVEYDDEAVTATAMTVDRCHFVITMYRGSSKRLPFGVGVVDFSHGVIVECMRISGSVLSFHRACRAVLQSAMGQSAGDDDRKSYTTSVLEFRRLKQDRQHRSSGLDRKPSRSNFAAADALDQALKQIQKDRFDCQELGMEQLIGLTSADMCGQEIAALTSMQVLEKESWLWNRLKHAVPTEEATKKAGARKISGSSSTCLPNGKMAERLECLTSETETSTSNEESVPVSSKHGTGSAKQDSRHDIIMRASSLRVLCNALSTVSETKELGDLANRPDSPLNDRDLLDALVDDMAGANRPPSVAMATAGGHPPLSSAHEAALAIRCLRLLGVASKFCYEYLQREFVMERLQMARSCGQLMHSLLEQEAEWTHSKLSQDLRSC